MYAISHTNASSPFKKTYWRAERWQFDAELKIHFYINTKHDFIIKSLDMLMFPRHSVRIKYTVLSKFLHNPNSSGIITTR
jgi:hypothetical protein